MADYDRKSRGEDVLVKTHGVEKTWSAKAFFKSSGEPVVVNGSPLEMYGSDEQSALNRIDAALALLEKS